EWMSILAFAFLASSKYLLASYGEVVIGSGNKEAEVNVWQNGLLSINTNAHLLIGEEGKLTIKKGGALWIGPGAELIIKGKIVAEDGAYLCIHQTAKILEASKKNIKIEGKVQFTDNPQMKFGLGGCIIISK
ncbi:MAG: hypothetical protein J7497_16105, partial [Chitinophagaceae bacterium]|nr:hypothetical protein [Chitinophagaceae bacterium]